MLKNAFMIAVLLGSTFPPVALAGTPSDTIPTSELTATYQLAPANTTSAQAVVTVQLAKAVVSNGNVVTENLDQSADDVVTFSTGTTSVVYDPSNANNTIALVNGATYTATFKRFNGETYTSSVVMPAATTFSAPAMHQVFKKTDAVTMSWNAVQAQEALFIIGVSDCATFDLDGLAYNADYTSAILPAGSASSCTAATVPVQFIPIYANGGTGFGSFTAVSQSEMDFAYGAASSDFSSLMAPTGKELLRLVAQARLAPNHTLILR